MKDWIQQQIVGPIRETAKRVGLTRSSGWNKKRNEFIKNNPCCAVCGKTKTLNVHHIIPFHMCPELEMEDSNLITLCRHHHFLIGHLNYWRSWNDDVVVDSIIWNKKLKNRPSKKHWKKRERNY